MLERELARDGGDLWLAEQAVAAIRAGVATLSTSPSTCRKAGPRPFLRELIIPFGRSGYVALFEIASPAEVVVVVVVVVVAVRHQREDDDHCARWAPRSATRQPPCSASTTRRRPPHDSRITGPAMVRTRPAF